MFTKNLTYNYNAQELLSVTSRLNFASNAWVALILYYFWPKKKTWHKTFQPIVLGLHDYSSTCSTNNYDTIPHHFWLPFSQEPTIEHKPSYHSSDIRNMSIFRRCSKRSIFKYFLKNHYIIQRLENWPLYQVFSSIFKKAQKNVKYAYVWIELRVCHYYASYNFHFLDLL
jgi:hypothetical protein